MVQFASYVKRVLFFLVYMALLFTVEVHYTQIVTKKTI